MNLQAVLALIALVSSARAVVGDSNLHQHRAVAHKRQGTSSSSSPSSSAAAPSSSSTAPAPSSARSTTSSSAPGATTTTSSTRAPAPTGPPPFAPGTDVPALESITFGMPTQATIPVTATFPAGAVPPVSGAPALPTPCSYSFPCLVRCVCVCVFLRLCVFFFFLQSCLGPPIGLHRIRLPIRVRCRPSGCLAFIPFFDAVMPF